MRVTEKLTIQVMFISRTYPLYLTVLENKANFPQKSNMSASFQGSNCLALKGLR